MFGRRKKAKAPVAPAPPPCADPIDIFLNWQSPGIAFDTRIKFLCQIMSGHAGNHMTTGVSGDDSLAVTAENQGSKKKTFVLLWSDSEAPMTVPVPPA
jgi:hypothetical protein